LSRPKVTVALPTYNRADYLSRAIEGVLNQTFTDYELVILDNASTDNTSETVRRFHDPRIKYVRHEQSIVGTDNLNKGFELADTPYLIITHDDDIMKPDLLKREVEILDEHKDVVIVSANVDIIDESNNTLAENHYPAEKDIVYNKYEFIQNYCAGMNIACPTVMFKMDFIREKNLRFVSDIGPAADTYLWFNINTFDKMIYVIKDSLYRYRIHSHQSSNVSSMDWHSKFYLYASRFLASNKLDNLVPLLRKKLFSEIICPLMYAYLKGKISLKGYNDRISKMHEVGLWEEDIPRIWKLKIFLMNRSPYLLKIFYKVKDLNKK